jgi:hypothetical protein
MLPSWLISVLRLQTAEMAWNATIMGGYLQRFQSNGSFAEHGETASDRSTVRNGADCFLAGFVDE